jgi:hypothetical protein
MQTHRRRTAAGVEHLPHGHRAQKSSGARHEALTKETGRHLGVADGLMNIAGSRPHVHTHTGTLRLSGRRASVSISISISISVSISVSHGRRGVAVSISISHGRRGVAVSISVSHGRRGVTVSISVSHGRRGVTVSISVSVSISCGRDVRSARPRFFGARARLLHGGVLDDRFTAADEPETTNDGEGEAATK